jgi:hypothetical protein
MRGQSEEETGVFSYVPIEKRIPIDHPIRKIKQTADRVLKRLSPVFDEMYSKVGRPSIPPEALLKAQILIALYTIRSERQFCERLRYDMLYLWFLVDGNLTGGGVGTGRWQFIFLCFSPPGGDLQKCPDDGFPTEFKKPFRFFSAEICLDVCLRSAI